MSKPIISEELERLAKDVHKAAAMFCYHGDQKALEAAAKLSAEIRTLAERCRGKVLVEPLLYGEDGKRVAAFDSGDAFAEAKGDSDRDALANLQRALEPEPEQGEADKPA